MYRPNQYKPTPAQDSFSTPANPMVFKVKHLSESISDYLPYVNGETITIYTILLIIITNTSIPHAWPLFAF